LNSTNIAVYAVEFEQERPGIGFKSAQLTRLKMKPLQIIGFEGDAFYLTTVASNSIFNVSKRLFTSIRVVACLLPGVSLLF